MSYIALSGTSAQYIANRTDLKPHSSFLMLVRRKRSDRFYKLVFCQAL